MGAPKPWAVNMEENKDIEKVTRIILKDFSMDAGEHTWSRLDAELDKKQAALYKKRANRFKLLSACLGFFLCSFITCHYVSRSTFDSVSPVAEIEKTKIQYKAAEEPAGNNDMVKSTHTDENIPETDYKSNEETIFNRLSKRDITKKQELSLAAKSKSSTENLKSNNVPTEVMLDVPETDNTGSKNKLNQSEFKMPPNNINSWDIRHNDSAWKMEANQPALSAPDADSMNSPIATIGVLSGMTEADGTSLQPDHGKNRFSIAAFYAPSLSFHNLKDNTDDGFDDATMYNNRENGQYSFFTGLLLDYSISPRWSVASGFHYSVTNYAITLPVMHTGYNESKEMHYLYPTASGVIQMPLEKQQPLHEGDSLEMTSVCDQSLKYLEVPMLLRIETSKNRFTFYANAGISLNFLLQEKATMSIHDEEVTIINNIDGLKQINYSVLLGAGIEYDVYHNTGIFLEPVFKTAITSINRDMAVNSYPYSIGLKIGASLRF
ncbi:MAG: outer membrane beta-barrel protein [Chitinophagales bacterium]